MFVKMEDKQPIIKNISFDRSQLSESNIIELWCWQYYSVVIRILILVLLAQ